MSKPTIKCIKNDNIFAILGAASHALDMRCKSYKIKEMQDKVWKSGSYSDALRTIQEYVNIEYAEEAKEYTILIHRNGKVREVTGTLNYLIDYFGHTLETGIAFQSEKGNHKISRYPKNINSLIKNLNYSKANSAANGFDANCELYTLKKAEETT